jgi:hypothetical protein
MMLCDTYLAIDLRSLNDWDDVGHFATNKGKVAFGNKQERINNFLKTSLLEFKQSSTSGCRFLRQFLAQLPDSWNVSSVNSAAAPDYPILLTMSWRGGLKD